MLRINKKKCLVYLIHFAMLCFSRILHLETPIKNFLR